MIKRLVVALLAVAMVLAPVASASTLTSTTQTVTISVSVNESISLSCTPNSESLTVTTPSTTNQSIGSPISCTVNWLLATTRTSVNVYEYFTTSTPFVAPEFTAGMITASVNGGAVTPFSNTSTTNGGVTGFFGPTVGTQTFAPTDPIAKFSGSQTDTIQLGVINSTALHTGTYNGTLNIVAVAI